MYLRDLVLALRRRWYFALLALAMAGAVVAAVFARVGPDYSADSLVVLLPPATTVKAAQVTSGTAPNPLLRLAGLTDTRDLLVRSMGDQDTADELAKEASGTAVTIGSDVTSGAPLVTLTAEAKNPQQAVDALTVLNRKSVAALAKLQSRVGVPSEALITSLVLTQDTRATANHKRQLQMTIMLGIGTLVVALLLLALADGYLLTRRSSAEGRRTGSQARKSSSRATRKVPTEGPS